jgi:uncharacterized protein
VATDDLAQRDDPEVVRDPHHGLEVFLVLGVSLGASGLYALLNLIRAQLTIKGGIGAATATLNQSAATQHWLDLMFQLANVVTGVMPALLALLLLWRDPGRPGFGIGLTWDRFGTSLAQGAGFAALIGIPGLALVWAAHELGVNASIVASGLPDVWWRVPVSVLAAFQNGFNEEIIVIGFLLTRFAQMGWRSSTSVVVAAAIRGSYHLYQGLGGFFGNFVMGVIFGWWFTRTKRVVPLVVAHTILDAVSFIGYVYLAGKVSWI